MKYFIILLLLFTSINAENFTMVYDGDSSKIDTGSGTMEFFANVTNPTDEAINVKIIKESQEVDFLTVVCFSGKCFMPTLDTVNETIPADTTVELKVNIDCTKTATGIVTVTIQNYSDETDKKSLAFTGTFTNDNNASTEDVEVAQSITLKAYPNPFNPTTTISFNMPTSSKASIIIYDVSGNVVTTLVNGQMNRGNHTATFNASQYPSGIYLAKFTSGSIIKTQKLLFVK